MTAADVTIRTARREDRGAIFDSTFDLAPAGVSRLRHRAVCRRDRHLAGADFVVAEAAGRVIGSVATRVVEIGRGPTVGRVGVVFGLHVVPEHRRRGLATRLLRGVVEAAEPDRLTGLYLRADAERRLFENVGFITLPDAAEIDGAVAMLRPVGPGIEVTTLVARMRPAVGLLDAVAL